VATRRLTGRTESAGALRPATGRAAQLVREARRGRGLSQRALAHLAGVCQPAVADIERGAHDTTGGQLQRLVGAAGYRLMVVPTTAASAGEWADVVYQELRSARHSEAVAFRALIGLSDDLAAQSGPVRVALCVAPPGPCGDPRFDAAVAAIVEHHLTQDHLPVPDWVHEPSRTLAEPWVASPHASTPAVPEVFRRHGVLLSASELASV
jgi:transcriptional regulator with XRE-family HTH domain